VTALPAGEPAVPVVSAVGVGKRYGPTVALHDVSLTVHPGESHALVGRNGAGSTGDADDDVLGVTNSDHDRVLIVKPRGRALWEIPGGVTGV